MGKRKRWLVLLAALAGSINTWAVELDVSVSADLYGITIVPLVRYVTLAKRDVLSARAWNTNFVGYNSDYWVMGIRAQMEL